MSTQQMIESLISHAPENKLEAILAFVQFVLRDEAEINNSVLSEPSLAADWMSAEEDAAWKDL